MSFRTNYTTIAFRLAASVVVALFFVALSGL